MSRVVLVTCLGIFFLRAPTQAQDLVGVQGGSSQGGTGQNPGGGQGGSSQGGTGQGQGVGVPWSKPAEDLRALDILHLSEGKVPPRKRRPIWRRDESEYYRKVMYLLSDSPFGEGTPGSDTTWIDRAGK
jgi:hypothetical protein